MAACRTVSSWRRRRRPISSPDGCALVSLIGSHIADRRRLEYLALCLSSAASQGLALDALYLSWHAASEELAEEAQRLLRAQRMPFRFRALRQRPPHSQYQHLRRCLAACRDDFPPADRSVWLTFADDDDLWHPRRARTFRELCGGASRRVAALSVGVYAYPIAQPPHEARTAADAAAALASQRAALWVGASEIFQFAVRQQVLAAFLQTEPECMLSHRFADVRFAQFIRHQQCGAEGVVHDVGTEELLRLLGAKNSDIQDEERPSRTPPVVYAPFLCPLLPSISARRGALLSQHWMYFYRNTRQLTQTTQLNSLADMQAYTAEAAHLAVGSDPHEEGYERTSTGMRLQQADLEAARALAAQARKRAKLVLDVDVLASEIGRMRHHAELCVVMCLHLRNAPELAVEMCRQAVDGTTSGHPPALEKLLWEEQVRLVHEACRKLEHGSSHRGELPDGTIQECIS
ncbi:hypothetical protein AB1Y20_000179 [Prymnesium parvum]|uniref:Glycosyltransferase 2-like domain-containing protein n=1 Tax=Prymnesium parvum TaxID=97485 RepID=A0AB34K9Q7_PRYPA